MQRIPRSPRSDPTEERSRGSETTTRVGRDLQLLIRVAMIAVVGVVAAVMAYLDGGKPTTATIVAVGLTLGLLFTLVVRVGILAFAVGVRRVRAAMPGARPRAA